MHLRICRSDKKRNALYFLRERRIYQKMKIIFILLSFVLVAVTAACSSGGGGVPTMVSGTLVWDLPTQYTDGSPLAPGDLKGCNVYYSLGPSTCPTGSYYFVSSPSWSVSLQDMINSPNLASLPSGTYEFAVTALDQNDMESACSNTVSHTF